MKSFILPGMAIFLFSTALAQKKPLDHSVYDGWQHIGEKLISDDGRWIVYTVEPQQGDAQLFIRSWDGRYEKSVDRGYEATITGDSRYVICKIKPPFRDTREARIRKKKNEEMPKDSLAVIELGKDDIWKTEKVKNYKTPLRSFGWVAYQLEKPVEQPGKKLPEKKQPVTDSRMADSLNRVIDSLRQIIESSPKKKKKKGDDTDTVWEHAEDNRATEEDAEGDDSMGASAEVGSDLVLRNLRTGEEFVFYQALEYYFSPAGGKLVVEEARNPADSFSLHQVLLYDLITGSSKWLVRGGNDFRNFALSEDGSKIAFLAEREAKPRDLLKFYKLWYFQDGMDSAMKLLDRYSVGMKLGLTPSEFGTLSFSKSGGRLFFGTAPIGRPKDTSLVEFEHPRVDIWHYNDDYLQTVQTFPARLRNDQQRNYLAVYDFSTGLVRQLATPEIPQVILTREGDGEYFIGVTDVGKRIESQWTGVTKKDIYAIQVATGEKKLLKKDLLGQVYPSSTGKYILWYDGIARDYFTWDGTVTRPVTDQIKVPLYDEQSDRPREPANYGVMGWQQSDSAVFIYDRYDVWKVDPQGRIPPSTLEHWREKKITQRYVATDPEAKYISSGSPVFFRLFNQVTKKLTLETIELARPEHPVYYLHDQPLSISNPVKAKHVFRILLTEENFNKPPDLYALEPPAPGEEEGNSSGFQYSQAREIKITSINPQQAGYLWGSAELFNWKAYNGKDATGIVYKPENFDPRRKYPMIVYFYERLSQDLYDYKEPAPIRSAVNIPFFVSRGYVLFLPDIEYKVGHPGQSAYDYVVSGARALVKKGWVDSSRIALQGHSWGGYQAAQLATMSKLFKAVWAGAPVANMTSAYGGIRWESGVSRQFQYEKDQSRIGASLWEKLPLYIENSPLFHLDRVTAPMVIMANDADGAVPWYQGIELFTGLRRLGKKVWMLDYNGQGHGLTQRQDMFDYQVRMQQFFDWILKGEKPAKWITEGVPAVDKGKDWGLEIVN